MISFKKERARKRECVYVCEGEREKKERKIVIANPSTGNVANEEVYTSCLNAQLV